MSIVSDTIRKKHHSFCSAVIVAAGMSVRMGEDKLFLRLTDVPVLGMTLRVFNDCDAIDEIVVVTRPERAEAVGALRDRLYLDKLAKVVFGGDTRSASALAGVTAVSKRAKIIAIHDGARPLVTEEVIQDAVHQAVLYQAATPAIPLKDTVKQAKNGIVQGTPPRSELYAVQTPQVFQADLIKAALSKAAQEKRSYTDDCAAVEALGCPVHLSEGDEDNIKITTTADLAVARAILEKRRQMRL